MEKDSKIFVAGHRGLVGSAIVRKLKSSGYTNIMTADRNQYDLRSQFGVNDYFYYNRPEYVFLAAAKVGGIKANSDYKADFITDNILIQTNVISACQRYGVKKLVFLGSSCIYPKMAPQPIKEEYLMTGPLEPTNDAYAIAKISGIKMCQSYNQQYGTDFVSVMPCNMYGVGDNYHPNNSHVLPAMIRKFHEAKSKGENSVGFWGDGTPYREFLFSDDLADACHFVMSNPTPDLINVGSGTDLTIRELASKIRDIVHPGCKIEFDGRTEINGTPKKLLDVSKMSELGWTPKISLEEGIGISYKDFLERHECSHKN
jgi:GDP-L-fucose synthase